MAAVAMRGSRVRDRVRLIVMRAPTAYTLISTRLNTVVSWLYFAFTGWIHCKSLFPEAINKFLSKKYFITMLCSLTL